MHPSSLIFSNSQTSFSSTMKIVQISKGISVEKGNTDRERQISYTKMDTLFFRYPNFLEPGRSPLNQDNLCAVPLTSKTKMTLDDTFE